MFSIVEIEKTVQIIPAKKEDDYSPSKSTLAKTLRKFPIKAAADTLKKKNATEKYLELIIGCFCYMYLNVSSSKGDSRFSLPFIAPS